ncbi:hypothetical protein [Methylobacterium sp. CM6247]
MTRTGENVLKVLDRFIVQGEGRRISQLLLIAGLFAGGKPTAEAENDLGKIQTLLREMREQRRIQGLMQTSRRT